MAVAKLQFRNNLAQDIDKIDGGGGGVVLPKTPKTPETPTTPEKTDGFDGNGIGEDAGLANFIENTEGSQDKNTFGKVIGKFLNDFVDFIVQNTAKNPKTGQQTILSKADQTMISQYGEENFWAIKNGEKTEEQVKAELANANKSSGSTTTTTVDTSKLDELTKAVEDAKAKVENIKQEIATSESRIQMLTNSKKAREAQVKGMEQALKTYASNQSAVDGITKSLKSAQDALAKVEQELEEEQNKLAELKKNLQTAQTNQTTAEKALEEAKASATTAPTTPTTSETDKTEDDKNADLKKAVDDAKAEIEKIKAEIASTEESLDTLNSSKASYESQIAAMQKAYEQNASNLFAQQSIQNAMTNAQSALTNVNNQIANAQSRLTTLNGNLTTAQAKLAEAEKALQDAVAGATTDTGLIDDTPATPEVPETPTTPTTETPETPTTDKTGETDATDTAKSDLEKEIDDGQAKIMNYAELDDETLASKLDELKSQLAGIESEVEALDAKYDNDEISDEEYMNALNDIQDREFEIQREIDIIEAAKTYKEEAALIDKMTPEQQAELEDVTNRLIELTGKQYEITSQLQGLYEQAESLNEQYQNGEITADKYNTEFDKLVAKESELKASLAEIEKEVEPLNNQRQALFDNAGKVSDTTTSTTEPSIDDVQNQILEYAKLDDQVLASKLNVANSALAGLISSEELLEESLNNGTISKEDYEKALVSIYEQEENYQTEIDVIEAAKTYKAEQAVIDKMTPEQQAEMETINNDLVALGEKQYDILTQIRDLMHQAASLNYQYQDGEITAEQYNKAFDELEAKDTELRAKSAELESQTTPLQERRQYLFDNAGKEEPVGDINTVFVNVSSDVKEAYNRLQEAAKKMSGFSFSQLESGLSYSQTTANEIKSEYNDLVNKYNSGLISETEFNTQRNILNYEIEKAKKDAEEILATIEYKNNQKLNNSLSTEDRTQLNILKEQVRPLEMQLREIASQRESATSDRIAELDKMAENIGKVLKPYYEKIDEILAKAREEYGATIKNYNLDFGGTSLKGSYAIYEPKNFNLF